MNSPASYQAAANVAGSLLVQIMALADEGARKDAVIAELSRRNAELEAAAGKG